MTKKLQQNLIAIGVIFIFSLFVYFKYLLAPLKVKHMDLIGKIESIERKVVQMKQKALELPMLEAEMKYLQKEVKLLEDFLPREKEEEKLIRILTKTAQKNNIILKGITPGKEAKKGNHVENPYKLIVKASYHGLSKFLTELGNKPRILSSENLMLNSFKSTENKRLTVNATLDLVSYTFAEK